MGGGVIASGREGAARSVKRLLSPKVLIPTILSFALFSFLIGLSGRKELLSALALSPARAGMVTGLVFAYFAFKGLAWFLFLRRLDIKASPPEIAFCFSGGEVAKNLPGGVFFQNYLLNRIMGAHFAYTAGASLALMGLEGVVTYVVLLCLGLPHLPWLRGILGLLAGVGLGVLAASWWWALPHRMIQWGRTHRHARIQAAAGHLDHFVLALKTLSALHLITPGILLVAGFLASQALMLYVIAAQLPIAAIGILPSIDVLAFSIFLPLVFPFPIQFGFTELSGVAAMMFFGAGRKEAIAAMIAYRVWGMGVSMLMGLIGMLLMPRLLSKALAWPPPGDAEVPVEPSRMP